MRLFRLLALAFLLAVPGLAAAQTADRENLLYIDLDYGRVVIQLRPDIAPKHVARVKELARAKFYDGIKFHRVIDGFMAQTGDPTGTGTGGSGRGELRAEFSRVAFERGIVGAARSSNPNSADSQFFIMFARNAGLDGQYTVWGRVVSGMEFVDKIKRGEPPRTPDRMLRVRVAADEPN
ncbi:MAG: peptidylprolyl isomerase [Rhodospirillales bacterium]|nr:peptidylprolyl isomerase [Rhodospirillales bacterium]